MRTQLTKPELAKLYREFSRQKYNKYRHQFPRMRESELVSKIIKEWEALTPKEKENLYETYMAEKHISDDKSESSERKVSPGSSKSKKKYSSTKIDSSSRQKKLDKQTPVKKAGVKVYVRSSSSKKEKEQGSESSDYARDGAKKDFEISESSSKEIGKPIAGKRKRITKSDATQPKTQYLKFFKFYYEKLSKEHSRWSANQISTIIKLLWKRKLATDKASAKALLRAPKERRRISGRMAFRRTYNYTGIEVAQRWKQLPIESKKYWRLKGEGLRSGERRVISSHVHFEKSGRKLSETSVNIAGKPLSFLSRSIAA